MTGISILVPTGKRPIRFKEMVSSALVLAETPQNVQILAYVAETDPEITHYKAWGKSPWDLVRVIFGNELPTSEKWNLLARKTSSDLLMLGADDIIFETPGWDRILEKAAAPFRGLPHVFHFRDSRHYTNTPHPIMTRAWMELYGFFVPPWFFHYYVDTWTCWVAKLAGVFTPIPEVLLRHDKDPSTHSRFLAGRKATDQTQWGSATPSIEIALSRILEALE